MRSRFIKQRQKNDCGIAAVATVAHKSYAEIRRLCGPVGRGGLYDHEMLFLLNHYGNWRITIPRKWHTLDEWTKKYPLCVVNIGMVFDDTGHALAIVDGAVWCPTLGVDVNLERGVVSSIIPA